MYHSVIIIGAGAAGLMAAKELSAQGEDVIVLEANDRTGGRIHTYHDDAFEKPAELGAEFIHGNLPLTIQLLKEANISYTAVGGRMIRVRNGEWKTQDEFIAGWDKLMQRMNGLKDDMTVNNFLQEYFSDEKYAGLRRSVQGFAEGFDLADITKANVFALRNEWMHEEEEQYRIPGGYQLLVDFLERQSRAWGCEIHTSTPVKEIHRQKGEVKIVCADGKIYSGNKVIVTVSLGTLQANQVSFIPSIDRYIAAAKQMGYGTVIKILLQFQQPFWNAYANDTGFILSDQAIPTWWTQLPDQYPLLTGWLGGPEAKSLARDEQSILQHALQSLCFIFSMEMEKLKQQLTAYKTVNWSEDVFALGGYSYDTLQSHAARKVLNEPVEQTIFFAGEALYEGIAPGTVEAALISGKEVAGKISAG